MKKLIKNSHGQAVVEYLIIFSFMALVGVKFVQAINGMFGKTLGNFTSVLTEKLKSGVCKDQCYFNGYKNLGDN